jgi:hypothetical protein
MNDIKKDHEHVISYSVDGNTQTTTEKELTPMTIIQNSGLDPETNYLIQIVGNNKISYKDKATEPIKMHENIKFITNSTGPTQVS